MGAKNINSKVNANGSSGYPYRVLIVEDDAHIAEIVEVELQEIGFEKIVKASNGQEAYNKAVDAVRHNAPFDIIISDWTMPKMTGVDLLKKLRSNAYYRWTPFLMLTGRNEKEFIAEAIETGVDGYLIKPFQSADLEGHIQKIVKKISS